MSHNFVFPCVDLDLANGYGYREIQNFCMHVTVMCGRSFMVLASSMMKRDSSVALAE